MGKKTDCSSYVVPIYSILSYEAFFYEQKEEIIEENSLDKKTYCFFIEEKNVGFLKELIDEVL